MIAPFPLCSPCAFATACCTLRSPSVLCPPTLHYSTAHCSVEGTISIIACVVAWLPRQATYGWSAVPDRWNDWNLITASSCTPVLLADGSGCTAHSSRMPWQVALLPSGRGTAARALSPRLSSADTEGTGPWKTSRGRHCGHALRLQIELALAQGDCVRICLPAPVSLSLARLHASLSVVHPWSGERHS